ncbi:MAG: metal-binding protein [Burkholderiales bacterium]|jgi:uncharacterized protein|nr:metal-binding protein [Burkholderiales bacterium]
MKYIDNVNFAKKQRTINGSINSDSLKRTAEILEELGGDINYTIAGSIDHKNKPVLTIRIYGKITTLCQNCLEKLDIPIDCSNDVPIFYTEADMDNALFGDEAGYDDGILADANFDIESFVEDELIMSLPIAPKHKTCNLVEYHDKPNNPFSVLMK